jgi:hypothetical protein
MELDMLVSVGIFAALVALAVFLLFGLKSLLNFVKVKVGESQFNTLVDYAELAVRAAEQLGIRFEYTGEEKKNLVLGQVRALALKFGFQYDEAFLDELIEAAVQKMNAEFSKLLEE